MKPILKQILKDREKGYVLSQYQLMMVQSQWLKLFGRGGCSYPYTSEGDMIKDLLHHYNMT